MTLSELLAHAEEAFAGASSAPARERLSRPSPG
jgi:hypothetical protein